MIVRNGARAPAAGAVRHGPGFWLIAAAFAAAMAFSTVPAPLYPLYQRRDGFSAFVTIVFAVYAAGVVASLLLAGHVSDWVGRKRILIPAPALEVVAAVVLLAWPALPGLLAGRFVTAPLRTPYLVFAVLLLLGMAAVGLTPETCQSLRYGALVHRTPAGHAGRDCPAGRARPSHRRAVSGRWLTVVTVVSPAPPDHALDNALQDRCLVLRTGTRKRRHRS